VSVTFSIAGERHDCEDICDDCWARMLNVHNANGAELTKLLGLEPDLGQMRARALAARCRVLLAKTGWDGEAHFGTCGPSKGARVIVGYRQADRLREHVTKLLHIADLAGDLGVVVWD
jgi:hypothetical protein